MTNKKIAYLAPEIPALSATFVYQEIMLLQEMGIDIIPISIHVPKVKAENKIVRSLEESTYYLYKQNFSVFLSANISIFSGNPLRYLKTLTMAVMDAFRMTKNPRVALGLLYRFFVSSQVALLLKSKHCQHLHINFAHIPTDVGMYASALTGITFSFTSHANDLFERGWLLKEKIERAKFVVTISEYNKDFLVNQGADKNKIHIVHCGVSSKNFYFRESESLDMPAKIGALGRMVEKKGFDVLIRACSLLKSQGFSFKLSIAGDGPLRHDLELLINKYELGEEVSLVGSLSHDNVSEWLQDLDVFVLPCVRDKQGDMDGIPVVLMEAMLSGVPVISSNISGIPELIIDSDTGLLCESNNHESLAKKIKTLTTDDILRNELRRNAIKKVKTDFDLDKNAELLYELLQ